MSTIVKDEKMDFNIGDRVIDTFLNKEGTIIDKDISHQPKWGIKFEIFKVEYDDHTPKFIWLQKSSMKRL